MGIFQTHKRDATVRHIGDVATRHRLFLTEVISAVAWRFAFLIRRLTSSEFAFIWFKLEETRVAHARRGRKGTSKREGRVLMKRAARKIEEKFDRGTKCRGSIIIVKRIRISRMFICITSAITYSRMTFKTDRIQINVYIQVYLRCCWIINPWLAPKVYSFFPTAFFSSIHRSLVSRLTSSVNVVNTRKVSIPLMRTLLWTMFILRRRMQVGQVSEWKPNVRVDSRECMFILAYIVRGASVNRF